MAPNPRVAKAFRAMRDLGISEDIVKPVLKNLLKLYDKNWELIEEENYRALADAIFDYEETKEAEQKKKSQNINHEEDLEEEAQVHDEPERPLKRLRLRNQEGQVSSSLGNSNPRLGGTSSRKSKVDGAEVSETCSRQQSQDITESPQLNLGNLRDDSQPVSPRPHLRNKGKQPISPTSLAAQERSDPSQPCATDRTHPSVTKRTESDSLSPQIRLREKGKELLSPQIPPREKRLFSERSSHALRFKEPKVEPGIVLLPKKKVPNTHVLIKPKDEPFTDDMAQFEVPIAVIPPDALCQGDSSIGNDSTQKLDGLDPPVAQCADGEGKGDSVPASSNEKTTNYELANIPEESPPNIEIASSPLGEVKISLSCNSAIGRPDFHMPSLDAVLKLVEDKCLRSYRIIDPNFSVMKLMREMCESFLELGTESTDELQERSIDVTPTLDSLNKSSNAGDALGAGGGKENFGTPSSTLNGSVNVEVLVPEILRLPPSLNGLDDHIHPEKKINGNGCGESDEEKEPKDPNYESSRSLVVVQQCHLTLDDIRSLYDNDISKGEERIRISFVNEINSDFPPSFHYIPQNLVFQNAHVNFSLARIGDEDCCSTCFGNCLSSSVPCACAKETGGEFAYNSDGLVKEEFLEECISMNHDPQQHRQFYCKECPIERSKKDEISEPCKGHLVRKFIKECWSKCGCSKQCGNRLVQRGITRNLQVFLTPEGKGWGLRTLEDLPKGAFVCEYVGEILTNLELHDRNTRSTSIHTYPVLLDADWGSEKVLKDEEALCLDATFYGNVARFINHRCLDANLVEIPVEVETPDLHYYHLAFFTTRKIDALEELTWDYGIDFDDHDHPVKAFRCRCGSKFCRNMKRSNRSRSATVR